MPLHAWPLSVIQVEVNRYGHISDFILQSDSGICTSALMLFACLSSDRSNPTVCYVCKMEEEEFRELMERMQMPMCFCCWQNPDAKPSILQPFLVVTFSYTLEHNILTVDCLIGFSRQMSLSFNDRSWQSLKFVQWVYFWNRFRSGVKSSLRQYRRNSRQDKGSELVIHPGVCKNAEGGEF